MVQNEHITYCSSLKKITSKYIKENNNKLKVIMWYLTTALTNPEVFQGICNVI